ncbi:MAG: 4-alpha-glucanotransferase [Rhabdochlamydiaceae bacterium]
MDIPTKKHWSRIGFHPHKGFCLPLSALKTHNSCGIGEFLDLIPLIGWAQEIKVDIIQLLPLNDSDLDPSPYNPLSSKAFHPIYLSLKELPFLSSFRDLQNSLKSFTALNKTTSIEYRKVFEKKMDWLLAYYKETRDEWLQDKDFIDFKDSQTWVEDYAIFKTLKQMYKGDAWWNWPLEWQNPSVDLKKQFCQLNSDSIGFFSLLQYLCYKQLKQVKEKALKHKVFIKGDIPILISKDSVDVWAKKDLFILDLSVGAPPDQYNSEGQYWGFPVPNYDNMKNEGFNWWKERIAWASLFYDIFRIDHVVGLFRLWAIPLNASSSQGFFLPKESDLWEKRGEELLKIIIEASSMLPIAEDLGSIPQETKTCLANFGICGTKVVRWERFWDKDKQFIPFHLYPLLSVTCLSTHDSEPLGLWWINGGEEVKEFAEFLGVNMKKELDVDTRLKILQKTHQSRSLFQINLIQEYLALFPDIHQKSAHQDRINIPGVISCDNWTYRLTPFLEELIKNTHIKETLKTLFDP